jgi:dihydropteroate synthase
MGIVNVTPDSFFDGGRYFDAKQAVKHGLELVAEGAEILDVGGESTRPDAVPVEEAEELRRVVPVIEALVAETKAVISIDTMKPSVARAALKAGATIINDVAANRQAPDMWRLAVETGAGYVAMHMAGNPRTMQQNPTYSDVVDEVDRYFQDRLECLLGNGLVPEQIILDPGIGFGKTVEHNLQLLASLRRFTKWKRPLLLGVSRKSFIGKLTGADVGDRLPGGLACACWAVQSGAGIVRTHDVAATVQAVRMYEALVSHEKK